MKYKHAVVLAGIGINLCLGIIYTWSVFSKELTATMNWSVTDATIPYTIAIITWALMMTPGGKLQERYGGGFTCIIAGMLIGTGMIISSVFTTLIGVSIGFGLFTGSAIALGYSTVGPTAVKWFLPSQKGLIIGLVTGGFGGAAIYASTLAKILMDWYGIRKSFFILGLAYMLLILALSRFIKNPPDGYMAQPNADESFNTENDIIYNNAGSILKTKQYYGVFLIAMFTSVGGLMVVGHASRIISLYGVDWGYILVSVFAVGNTFGRPASGIFLDKLGRRTTCLVFYGLPAIAMFALLFVKSAIVASCLLVVVAVAYGATASINPSICAEFYGIKSLGLSFGLVFIGWGVGGVFGPLFASIMYDKTGGYMPAFLAGGILLAAASIIGWLLNPPVRKVEKEFMLPESSKTFVST